MARKRKGKRRFAMREGDPVGKGGLVVKVEKPDEHGHRYVLVFWDHPRSCPTCHGKPTRHRSDHLRSRKSDRVVSCGSVKAANYKAHLSRQWQVDVHGKDIHKTARKR